MLFLGIGFLGWLIATIAFRFIGQYLLDPTNIALSIGLFLATPIAMFVVITGVYFWQQVKAIERPKAALLIALPGMILDAGSVLSFSSVFPNIDPNANTLFAALMLWGYSSILATGFLPQDEL
ncbi:MAG: DUF5367 domain-containing protein [Plectolyngbya sp. WJT66-NPBG17]|jgi:hypothetical protein|nr:DUF5367 domain-containing protein [Plectolyngbya sp. WJT66-NPBG17]MBW4525123.1 DUF5367 domain-containing protein [Phormidium tanganyikae FI6-MK23]